MADLLAQALELTVLGMGMTFLSIGALVGGMYLLTFLTTSRAQGEGAVGGPEHRREEDVTPTVMPVSEGATSSEDGRERRRRAAAAAVAVTLALAESRKGAPAGVTTGDRGESAWSSYARSLQLSRRMRYEAQKSRPVR